jgi:LEA14-like dessication related protein
MKSLKPIFYVTGIGIIVYAIYRYYQNQIGLVKKVDYKISGVKIVNLSKDSVSVDITATIYNATNIEATIEEVFLDFSINGIKVGNIQEAKQIVIKPLGTTDVTYRFSFDPKIVLGNVVNLITFSIQAKDVNFEANGYVKLKSDFVEYTAPFDYKGNLGSYLNKK